MAHQVEALVKDEVFLLRSTPYGDHHRILSCLSSQHGRINLIAYSARQSIKRFSGILDFIHCLKIEFKPHRQGGLGQLVNCELKSDFEKIRQSYQRSMIALRWLRFLSQALQEAGQVVGLFSLLHESLKFLEEKNEDWVDLIFRQRVLTKLGYHLELTQCARCGNNQARAYCFFPHEGGLLCEGCRPKLIGIELTEPFAKHLWTFHQDHNPWQEARVAMARHLLQEGFRQLLGFANEFAELGSHPTNCS